MINGSFRDKDFGLLSVILSPVSRTVVLISCLQLHPNSPNTLMYIKLCAQMLFMF